MRYEFAALLTAFSQALPPKFQFIGYFRKIDTGRVREVEITNQGSCELPAEALRQTAIYRSFAEQPVGNILYLVSSILHFISLPPGVIFMSHEYFELTVASSPHAHSGVTTQTVMRDVLLALIPALGAAVYFFGFRALALTAVSVAGCLFFEWLYRRLLKLDQTLWDLSAVVTGVLIAFVCPVTLPYWCILIGDFFAIIVVKQLFGGIGNNFVNPALAARAFLMSWPLSMSTWVKPGFANAPGLFSTADAVTAATPLAAMHQGQLPNASLWDLLLGNVGGSMGETCAAALLLGGIYLLLRRVIRWQIPVSFLGTVALLSLLFPQGNDRLSWTLCQLLSGGLILGAVFMATDYVTSPMTKWGQLIFGCGCGLLTLAIRWFGGYPEGVSYAILIMNCCVPLLDKIGKPRPFGARKEGAS